MPNMAENFTRCWILWATLKGLVRASPLDTVRQGKIAEMIGYMNQTLDPCEDFYEFACGNYGKYSQPLMDYQTPTTLTLGEKILQIVDARFKDELERETRMDSKVDRLVKAFYRSCLNIPSNLAELKNKRFASIRNSGRLPLLQGELWQERTFDWQATVAKMAYETGLATIFGLKAVRVFSDNSIIRVGLAEPKFSKRAIAFYNEEIFATRRQEYVRDISYDLKTLLNIDLKSAESAAKEIVQFEIALAQGKVNKLVDHEHCDIFTLTSLEDLQKKYWPDLDSRRFLRTALNFTPTEVYVQHQYLENALQIVKHTPKRIVANYIYYIYMKNFLFPHSLDTERLKVKCVKATHEQFFRNLNNMLARKLITSDMKTELNKLWREIKASFEADLLSTRLQWLPETTRRSAIHKLNVMQLHIFSSDYHEYDEQFSQLHMDPQDFVANKISLLAFRGHRLRAALQEPPRFLEQEDFSSYTLSYSHIENWITIPAVFVQNYYNFSKSYPKAILYGILGTVLAHEMMHGFDDGGRRYNSQGNIQNWWDSSADREFRNRTQCFIGQYRKYIYGGFHLPAMEYQAENIADNDGLRIAFNAYRQWSKNSTIDSSGETFKGLNYTSEQLFFISYAQRRCSNFNAANYKFIMATETHVPPKFRVIVPLSNMASFSQAFSCPLGSAMNPVEKCQMY